MASGRVLSAAGKNGRLRSKECAISLVKRVERGEQGNLLKAVGQSHFCGKLWVLALLFLRRGLQSLVSLVECKHRKVFDYPLVLMGV